MLSPVTAKCGFSLATAHKAPDNDAACLADLLRSYFFLSVFLSFSTATRPTVHETDISFSKTLLVS